MNYITLGQDGFAEESGWISCFVTNQNGEYIGRRDEYISATTGLPAGAYIDQPPEKTDGFAVVREGNSWELMKDNRGKKAYSCETGAESVINYIGDLREGFTLIVPSTPYDVWDGATWVTDTSAQKVACISAAEVESARLYSIASEAIEPLQDAVDLEIATDGEVALLKLWKTYRVLLIRVDVSKAPDVDWPEKPVM